VKEMAEVTEEFVELSNNLNWVTTQNRSLLNRAQQLEAILNAVQERNPGILDFLQETVFDEVGAETEEKETEKEDD